MVKLCLVGLASVVSLSCTEPATLSSPVNSPRRDLQEPPPPCKDCVLGPLELGISSGRNFDYTTEFKAIQGEYKMGLYRRGNNL